MANGFDSVTSSSTEKRPAQQEHNATYANQVVIVVVGAAPAQRNRVYCNPTDIILITWLVGQSSLSVTTFSID